MKKVIAIVLFSAIGGAMTLGAYKFFLEKPQIVEKIIEKNPVTIQAGNGTTLLGNSIENTDFTVAAEKTLNAVVHVKNTSYKTVRDPFSEFFYGQGSGSKRYSQVGTGSGVIISADGYIVTNNHVIQGATEIEITLNDKKIYEAELVGADPVNDIALLKIDESDLPYITFSDSNSVKVGEWVLAVGNPYNLTSTVTAGIVSAKGRDLQGNSGVDSFIQTDAAVNPGNSGGALVNIRGELVGINTAISSRTGSFVGYSFAVPSNIARKVIEDLIEFGNVQKAILGIYWDNEFKEEGVRIIGVTEMGGAEKAGLKEGDIILSIDNVKISKFSDLSGQLNSKRPGDTVSVLYKRNGSERETSVLLTKNNTSNISALGIEIRNMDKEELKELKLTNGVILSRVGERNALGDNVKPGYVITSINGNSVYTIDDVNAVLSNFRRGQSVRIEMRNLNGEIERFILQ